MLNKAFARMFGVRTRIIWSFVKPYPHYVVAVTVLSFMTSFFDAVNVVVLFSILNSVVGAKTGEGFGGGITHSIDRLIGILPVKDTVIAACLMLIISIILKNIFSYLQKAVSARASFRIWQDVQRQLFRKLITADYQYFLDHKLGEIVYRVYSAPASLGALLTLMPQALAELAKLLAVGAILLEMSPYASGAILLIGALFYYFTKYIASKVSYNLGEGRSLACEKQNVLLSETISGIRQIKVFASEKRWLDAFFGAMNDYFKLANLDKLIAPLPGHILETLTIIMLALLLIGVKLLYPGNFALLIPVLGTFAYAFQKIMPSLSMLGDIRIQIMGTLPIIEVVHSSLNLMTKNIPDGKIEIATFSDAIRFEGVNFSYPGRENVLKGIDLTFKRGEVTAIVGPSGAGKSTIADLIVKLFVPDAGTIFIDGVSIMDCQIATWLKKIGFVTQDTFIFNATLAENISFGLDVGLDEVIEAAKSANAHEFIAQLPDGYQTVVGDRGMKLSGGQRQRIAIARALVHKPELLILDEATSSLDNVSEAIVQAAINNISKNRTVIVIAHRLSTVIDADKIIVLNDGEVAEAGRHDELIGRGGLYYKLYTREKMSQPENKQTKKAELV
ncbi:MAG: ABC transporter ATP-binding protein [Candidatus Margulisbacteria bacterium]|nr:ABC transporter ATP-binding protein [Candidatus Margulisiibacteriota bacterium]